MCTLVDPVQRHPLCGVTGNHTLTEHLQTQVLKLETVTSQVVWLWPDIPFWLKNIVFHILLLSKTSQINLFYFLNSNQHWNTFSSVQFSSVAQSCPTLHDPMNCSTPGLPVHHQLSQFTQTHVHWVSNANQPSHPLSSPSLPAPNPCQHQGLLKWVSSSHQEAKVLEFQLQHQSFQWTPRTDLL